MGTVAAGAFMFVRTSDEFYAVAVAFRFAYTGVMPLYALLVRENVPASIIGTIVGATSMASSLRTAIGPLLGGLVFDQSHSYAEFYLGSFVIGLGAPGVMLAFRPARPTSAGPSPSPSPI